MAIVRQDAGRDQKPDPTRALGTTGSDGAVGLGISRRRFLVGAGVTLAATSVLGPWLKSASASSSTMALPDGFTTGVSDVFDQLAQQGGEPTLRTFDELVVANASSIRFPVYWDLVQPHGEAFDWSHYDAVYREVVFHGLKAHPVIMGCPEWVGASQRKRASNGVCYPTGSSALNSFGEFAVETLKHFATFGDQVAAVEVWSEPNNPRGAHISDPSEFSRMLSTVALFVAAANGDGTFSGTGGREMTVLSGGLDASAAESNWSKYLAGFQDQSFPYELGLHVPASSPSSVKRAVEYAEHAAEEIGSVVDSAVSQSGREVWVTGTGASARAPWGEDGQAVALEAVASALAERPQCRAMMVTGLRAGSDPHSNAMETALPMSGILRRDGSPTPALATLQTAWATT